ncbi:MAG TPA: helix-turn-helix domain-containing protein, partial [Pseudonocardiaceae bacterium]|nr:helix-turn-helix domain-containing protein [Pseudonocardiaceae bacterium]
MARWQPGASLRLERAALELFARQGFTDTTVPQIAARAGLTTRSFFRHFADKREVLFTADKEFPARVASLMAAAPDGLSLMELISWGLHTIAETTLQDQKEYLRARQAVIRTDEGLRERDLRKQAALGEAIAHALAGLTDALTATVAGQIAALVSSTAVERWLDSDGDT